MTLSSDLSTLKMVRDTLAPLAAIADVAKGTPDMGLWSEQSNFRKPTRLLLGDAVRAKDTLTALDQLIARLDGDGAKQPNELRVAYHEATFDEMTDVFLRESLRCAGLNVCEPELWMGICRSAMKRLPTHQLVSPEVDEYQLADKLAGGLSHDLAASHPAQLGDGRNTAPAAPHFVLMGEATTHTTLAHSALDEQAFEAFMLALHQHDHTGLGIRKCLAEYERVKKGETS